MMGHVALSREFKTLIVDLSPAVMGLEDCGNPFTHWKNRRGITEKNLARYFLPTQTGIEQGELEGAFWPPGPGNPADSLTKSSGDLLPLLTLSEA